jgi:RHS repeat-associated protein
MSSTAVTDRFFYQQDRLVSRYRDKHARLLYAEKLLAQLDARTDEHSMLLQTDSNGSVLNARGQQRIRAYTPYGFSPDDSGKVLAGFNGEYLDVVTLGYPLGQAKRFYLARARFNSPDPLSPFGEGGTNCYTYCEGDPVNFADPTGLRRFYVSSPPRLPSGRPSTLFSRLVSRISPNRNSARGGSNPPPSSSLNISNQSSHQSAHRGHQAAGARPQETELRRIGSGGESPSNLNERESFNLSQAWNRPGTIMQNLQIAIYLPYSIARRYPAISILAVIGIVGGITAAVLLTRKN